jgi:hypothetical protein
MEIVHMFADASGEIGKGINQACASACNTGTDIGGIFAGIANALIFLIGAIAVIMIIIGGLRYVTANGDSKATASAKDTILYSVIGLIVAIAAFAIVNFVVVNIGKPKTTPAARAT